MEMETLFVVTRCSLTQYEPGIYACDCHVTNYTLAAANDGNTTPARRRVLCG